MKKWIAVLALPVLAVASLAALGFYTALSDNDPAPKQQDVGREIHMRCGKYSEHPDKAFTVHSRDSGTTRGAKQEQECGPRTTFPTAKPSRKYTRPTPTEPELECMTATEVDPATGDLLINYICAR